MINVESKSSKSIGDKNSALNNPDVIVGSKTTTATALTDALKNHSSAQNIASHVELQKNAHVDAMANRPQLAYPTITIGNNEIDVAALKELAKNMDASGIEHLTGNFDTFFEQEMKQLEQEHEQHWQAFEGEYADLSIAKSKIENVIAVLSDGQAAAGAPIDIESATKEAIDLLVATTASLNQSMDKLTATDDPKHSAIIDVVKTDTQLMYQLMYTLQTVMKQNMITTMSSQIDIAKIQLKSMQDKAVDTANSSKKEQEGRDVLYTVLKWLGVVVAGAVSVFVAIGSFGTLAGPAGVTFGAVTGAIMATVGLTTTALTAVDMAATGGKITEAIMAPITKAMSVAVEGVADIVSKGLQALGVKEETAKLIGTIYATLFITGGTIAVAVAAPSVMESGPMQVILNTLKNTIGSVLSSLATKIASLIPQQAIEFLKNIGTAMANALSKPFELIATALKAALGKGMTEQIAGSFEWAMQKYLEKLSYMLGTISLGGATAQTTVSVIAAKSEQKTQEYIADLTMFKTENDLISNQIEENSDKWASRIKKFDEMVKRLSGVISSEEQLGKGISKNIAKAA